MNNEEFEKRLAKERAIRKLLARATDEQLERAKKVLSN